jgi:type II secretory pathway pseudopilin PulG
MRRPARHDDGFTLPELLVYVFILGVIVVVVGSVIANSTRAQNITLDNSAISNTTRTLVRSMENGIGNAASISVSSPTAYGQMVRVRTAVATSSTVVWRCQAWFYSVQNGGVYTKTASTLIPDFGSAPVLNGWTLLVGGGGQATAARQTSTPIPPATPTVSSVFSLTGTTTVNVRLLVRTRAAAPLTFTTTFGSQAPASGPQPTPTEAPTSCF